MRPPSVFVRPLLHEEAVRLKRLSRRAKHESTRQRASVLLARTCGWRCDYLDWDAFGYALANHIRYRNSDHRARRIAAAEAKHRIAG
jgi:hypothetical protein